MLYVWIENNEIKATRELELIPEQYKNSYQVFDEVPFTDLKIENGRVVLKTQEEKLNELKQQKILKLKKKVYTLLAPTDWCVIKCVELGLNIEQVYPNEKAFRDSVRAWGNQKEQEIMNATTIEEVNSINLNFEE